MKLKTKILNRIRTIGLLSPVESALVPLALSKTVGKVFAKIAPNNDQFPRNTIRQATRNGIRYSLDISDYMQYCIYFGIENEPREALYCLVKNGATVIDVGTNIGETLLNFAKINRDGRNIGFEPVPYLYEKALKNIGLNGSANVELVNKGLSSRKETLSFREAGEHNSGGIFLTRDNVSDAGRAVEVTTLDDFVVENQVEDISLIKIDVEGFEMEVLRGASKTLERWRPTMFVEIDNNFLTRQNTSAAAVFERFVSHGYRIRSAETGEHITSAAAIEGRHLDIIAEHRHIIC
jgi:FkbM family methyltransferase